MRLLFFAGGSYVGGMETVTMHLMAALRAKAHDARAIVSGWNDGVYLVERLLTPNRISIAEPACDA